MSKRKGFIKKLDMPLTEASVIINTETIIGIYPALLTGVHGPEYAEDISSASVTTFYELETSWVNEEAALDIDLSTSWNIGDTAYYWYRVTGGTPENLQSLESIVASGGGGTFIEGGGIFGGSIGEGHGCGGVICDNVGIEDGCAHSYYTKIISAQSLNDLCDILSNSSPPINNISLIEKYSRPATRTDATKDICGVYSPIDYCQIPECLKYCYEEEEEEEEEEEPLELSIPIYLTPDISTISSCGCNAVPLAISIRHNTNKSLWISKRNFISLEETNSMTYRPEGFWSYNQKFQTNIENFLANFYLKCDSNVWTFNISFNYVRYDIAYATKIGIKIPNELICDGSLKTSKMKFYIDQPIVLSNSNRQIQVTSPGRQERHKNTQPLEAYVNDIYISNPVYYDTIGMFSSGFWEYNPLEIQFKPINKGNTFKQSLVGFV